MAFDKPQSRNEAILQNMLGANNELEPPKSRVEALLQDIAGKMPEANPSEGTTTGTLERLKIGDDIYSVEGGGSGTSDYDALNNKPQIAGTTLSGNKSLADLGIASASAVSGILDGTDIDSFGDVETALGDKVDKVSGKGLSTNDYDDTEKAAVTAATTAIDGIKDGTDIDSFADVETALADKVDKVAGKGLSTNDYTNEDKAIVGGVTAALGGKADTDIVASDFSTSASYTAGDYCIYEGKFYKFKANHSGAWSAADVDEIKIAGELASLKSGLTNLHYHKVAESESTGTVSSKLLSLKTAYYSLSLDVRRLAILVRDISDVFNAINVIGAFGNIYVDASSTTILCFDVRNGKYIYDVNGTRTDSSETVNGSVFSLWVCN